VRFSDKRSQGWDYRGGESSNPSQTEVLTLWLCGSVALWLCGSVALWLCGSVALWLCGSVAQVYWDPQETAVYTSILNHGSTSGSSTWPPSWTERVMMDLMAWPMSQVLRTVSSARLTSPSLRIRWGVPQGIKAGAMNQAKTTSP